MSVEVEDCEFYRPSCDPAAFWAYFGLCVVLVTAAGLMAGLTMGLLSLDKLNMLILQMEGTELEKKQATKVLPILSQHHFLLVTLLLVNAGANEALPIFLSRLVPESVSIVLSVTCVLLFGEILPSAIFTGPRQLSIAASLTPIVKGLMLVTSPIAYPISRFLDYCLGDDHDVTRYKRKELKALITLQRESQVAKRNLEKIRRTHSYIETRKGDQVLVPKLQQHHQASPRFPSRDSFVNSAHSTNLHVDEVTIIHGALDLAAKNVSQVMIPIEDVFMLEVETNLDENIMADILALGHSRIPIFKDYPSNIVGLLLVKRLIVLDPEDSKRIGDLCLRKPIVTSPEESCYAILNEFQKGRSHIALVTKDARLVHECWKEQKDIPPEVEFVGIITIEDVIEELIQEEIEDESDMYVHDVVEYWKPKNRRERLRESGKLFVKRRLKVLAERARRRVRNRKAKQQQVKQPRNTTPKVGDPMEDTLDIKVVANETTPLIAPSARKFTM